MVIQFSNFLNGGSILLHFFFGGDRRIHGVSIFFKGDPCIWGIHFSFFYGEIHFFWGGGGPIFYGGSWGIHICGSHGVQSNHGEGLSAGSGVWCVNCEPPWLKLHQNWDSRVVTSQSKWRKCDLDLDIFNPSLQLPIASITWDYMPYEMTMVSTIDYALIIKAIHCFNQRGLCPYNWGLFQTWGIMQL